MRNGWLGSSASLGEGDGIAGNRRSGPRLCEKSEVQFGLRTSVSISSDLKTNSASNCRRRRQQRKRFYAFSANATFHTPWVTSGELVLFATFPLRPQNPTFARTSSGAASGQLWTHASQQKARFTRSPRRRGRVASPAP